MNPPKKALTKALLVGTIVAVVALGLIGRSCDRSAPKSIVTLTTYSTLRSSVRPHQAFFTLTNTSRVPWTHVKITLSGDALNGTHRIRCRRLEPNGSVNEYVRLNKVAIPMARAQLGGPNPFWVKLEVLADTPIGVGQVEGESIYNLPITFRSR